MRIDEARGCRITNIAPWSHTSIYYHRFDIKKQPFGKPIERMEGSARAGLMTCGPRLTSPDVNGIGRIKSYVQGKRRVGKEVVRYEGPYRR